MSNTKRQVYLIRSKDDGHHLDESRSVEWLGAFCTKCGCVCGEMPTGDVFLMSSRSKSEYSFMWRPSLLLVSNRIWSLLESFGAINKCRMRVFDQSNGNKNRLIAVMLQSAVLLHEKSESYKTCASCGELRSFPLRNNHINFEVADNLVVSQLIGSGNLLVNGEVREALKKNGCDRFMTFESVSVLGHDAVIHHEFAHFKNLSKSQDEPWIRRD